jgi:hypothetical protein
MGHSGDSRKAVLTHQVKTTTRGQGSGASFTRQT